MENLDQILSHQYSPNHQCHLGDENYDKSTNQNFLMMSHQNPLPNFQVSPKQNMFFFSLNSPLQNYDKFQFNHSYDREQKHLYKQISRKISYQEQNSADIKQQYFQQEQQIPTLSQAAVKISKRNSKGLKNLSIKVYEIVSEKGISSYLEVADRLVDELGIKNFTLQENGIVKKDEHNIKRRVYDALNVLISASLLRKQGKRVICNYNCENDQNSKLINYRAQRDKTKNQIRKKKALIQEKRNKLRLLQIKKQAIRYMMKRNREIQGFVKAQQKIQIPFIATKVATNSVLKIFNNSKEVRININQNFQVCGDADLLLQIQSFISKQRQDLFKRSQESTQYQK